MFILLALWNVCQSISALLWIPYRNNFQKYKVLRIILYEKTWNPLLDLALRDCVLYLSQGIQAPCSSLIKTSIQLSPILFKTVDASIIIPSWGTRSIYISQVTSEIKYLVHSHIAHNQETQRNLPSAKALMPSSLL